jgi:hypothetical protein
MRKALGPVKSPDLLLTTLWTTNLYFEPMEWRHELYFSSTLNFLIEWTRNVKIVTADRGRAKEKKKKTIAKRNN